MADAEMRNECQKSDVVADCYRIQGVWWKGAKDFPLGVVGVETGPPVPWLALLALARPASTAELQGAPDALPANHHPLNIARKRHQKPKAMANWPLQQPRTPVRCLI